MADIIIEAPFAILIAGDVHVDALPPDSKAVIRVDSSGIDTFEYKEGGNTYTLPTGGTAVSKTNPGSADLNNLSDAGTGSPPPTPYTLSVNSGTLVLEPALGTPYKIKITGVDADLKVTGAASAATYDSGGTVLLHGGGSGSPTRKTP